MKKLSIRLSLLILALVQYTLQYGNNCRQVIQQHFFDLSSLESAEYCKKRL